MGNLPEQFVLFHSGYGMEEGGECFSGKRTNYTVKLIKFT